MTFDFAGLSTTVVLGFALIWLVLLAIVWLPKQSTPEERYMEWQRRYKLPEVTFQQWLGLPRTANVIPPRWQSTLCFSVLVWGLFFYYLATGCRCVSW